MAIDYLKDLNSSADTSPPPQSSGGGTNYLADLKNTKTEAPMPSATPEPMLDDGPISETKKAMSLPIDKAAQAAYTGVLSFGSSLHKLATWASKGTPTVMNPLGPILEATAPTVNKYVDKQNATYQENLKQYPGLKVPNMIGQFVGSAPLSPAMGAINKIPGLVGDVLPTGLKTIGKYAAGAGSGMANAGLYGALSYGGPDNQDPINVKAAKELGLNPLSAIFGMAGTGIQSYMKQTNKLQQAEKQGFGSIVLNRDLKPMAKKPLDTLFGSVPIIGDTGRRFAQRQSFTKGTETLIKSISNDIGDVSTMSGTQALNKAAINAITNMKSRLGSEESKLWAPINAVQNKIIIDPLKIQTLKGAATKLLDFHGPEIKQATPGLSTAINRLILQHADDKPMSFSDLKTTKTLLNNYLHGTKSKLSLPAKQDIHQFIDDIYTGLDTSISKLDPKLVEQYHAANAFTSEKYKMFDSAGSEFKKAIIDNANAYKFMKALINEQSPSKVVQKMAPFNANEANQIRAGILAKHLKTSIDPISGDFNIADFINKTSAEKNIKELMGPTYKALEGLQNVMKPAQQALLSQNNMQPGMQYGAPMAATAGIATKTAATAAVIASAGVLAKISQYSPLKRLLISAANLSNNPRLLEKIGQGINTQMQRAGIIMEPREDGVYLQSNEDNE